MPSEILKYYKRHKTPMRSHGWDKTSKRCCQKFANNRKCLDNTVKTKRLVEAMVTDARLGHTVRFWVVVMLATHDSLSAHWHRAQAVSFDSFRWNQVNYGEHCKGGVLLNPRLLSYFLCCLTYEAHVVKLEWYHSTPFAEGMLVTVTGAKETPAARFRAVLHPSTLARFASDTFSSFATCHATVFDERGHATVNDARQKTTVSFYAVTMTANIIPETHIGIERMRYFSRTLDERSLAIIPHAREKSKFKPKSVSKQ